MLEITILKEDIIKYGYANSRTCSITQALARASRPELLHGGFGIVNRKLGELALSMSDPILEAVSIKVQAMSKFVGHTEFIDPKIPAIPPETFTVQLPID